MPGFIRLVQYGTGEDQDIDPTDILINVDHITMVRSMDFGSDECLVMLIDYENYIRVGGSFETVLSLIGKAS